MNNKETKKEILITKPTKYIRDIFAHMFGGIGGSELIICIISFFITAGLAVLGWFLPSNKIIAGVVIAVIVIFTVSITIFLIRTRGDKKKSWIHIHDKYKYEFDGNKKTLNAPDIFSLLNMERINDDGEIEFAIQDNKNGKGLQSTIDNKHKQYNNIHGAIYKLQGVNINLLTPEESNIVIDSMANPWLKIDINHKMIIVDEEIDVKPMNKYLDGIKENYKVDIKKINENNANDDEIKVNQLQNYKNINEQVHDQNIVNKGVYIIFLYTKESELSNAISEIQAVDNSTKISISKVEDKSKVCKILNTLYTPLTKEWFNSKSELGINKDLGQVKIFKDYMQIGDQYTKIIEVLQCPTLVTAGWMKKASNYRNIQTIVSLEKTDTDIVRNSLERSKRKIKLNWEFVRSEGESFQQSEYIDVMTNLIHDFAKGYSKPWYVNISFVITANSKEELLDITNSFEKEMRTVDRFLFNKYEYTQYNALSSIWSFRYMAKKKQNTYMEMSNDAIGAMYPFVSNALKDPQGVYFGYEYYSGDPFWFDLKMKESKLRNSNVVLICAKTGGGKTYSTCKICNWFKNTTINKNMKQYIVDPLGDYNGLLVNHYKVSKIDMTDAQKGLINPLQILDEEQNRSTKATEFIVWLSMLAKKDFSAKAERILTETILELYDKFKITDKFSEIKDETGEIHKIYDFGKINNKKWPIISDLLNLLKKKYPKATGLEEEIINIVWKVGDENGNYYHTWNGHTTLDVEDADIVILDTHSLDADRDPILFKCQMYLISSFLRGEALKNRDRNLGITDVNKLRWINIVVDEAHRWVKNNPIALKTLELLAREIRHHKGVLMLSTQNIADFKGEPEAILKQALYQIVLNMTPSDVTSYDELLKEAGGLTQNEKDFLINASIGDALVSIGSKYRCYVHIKANEIEEYMWLNGAK